MGGAKSALMVGAELKMLPRDLANTKQPSMKVISHVQHAQMTGQ